MKLLYYNWIQFDNREGIGGGVNVYQKNLIEYLVNNTDDEVNRLGLKRLTIFSQKPIGVILTK